ncbi:hypothetical protein [Pseudomonas phage Almagne]|nr:hypothetical protein [Pseudomonas phage Almagne]
MAQYTCNANMAADLLPMLVKRRAPFSIVWPRPDLAIFEGSESVMQLIQAEAIHLNLLAAGVKILPTEQWGYWDDQKFPLNDPAASREAFDRAVGKRIAPLTPDQEATVEDILVRNRVPYQRTVTARISDPQPQQIERTRTPASVGEQAFQSCGFLDTEFDSDPSMVGE